MAGETPHIDTELGRDYSRDKSPDLDKKTADKEKKGKDSKKDKKEESKAQPSKLAFKEAEQIARVVSGVLDKQGELVSPQELAYFGEILVRVGKFDSGEVQKMINARDPHIILFAQQILSNADITDAQESDWDYSKDTPQRKIQEEYIRGQIERVRALKKGQLALSDVSKYVDVEEFKKFQASKKGGPGAAEAGSDASRVDIRELMTTMVDLKAQGKDSGDGWNQLSTGLQDEIGRFTTAVSSKNFIAAYEFTQGLNDVVDTLPNDKKGYLDSVISEDQRNQFTNDIERLDKEFQTEYDKMDDKTRAIVFNDLELAVGIELQGVISGWRNIQQAKYTIFTGDPDRGFVSVVDQGVSKEKLVGLPGIRNWRAAKELYGVEERVSSELMTRPPARWEEVPEYLSNIYRLIESTDFTVEDLGHEIQKALAMLDSLRATTPETREMRSRLGKELEAFRAFHSMRVQMEREDEDPTNMLQLFRNYFDDETWWNFVTRYGRDERNREFVDKNGDAINTFDISLRLYSDRLRDERIKMNIVEEMTRHGLENEISDYEDFAKWTGTSVVDLKKDGKIDDFKKQVDEIRSNLKERMETLIKDPKNRLIGLSVDNVWGQRKIIKRDGSEIDLIEQTKKVIGDWHKEETLQGAVGYFLPTNNDGTPKKDDPNYGREMLDIKRDDLRGQLKKELGEIGLSVEKSKGEKPTEVDLDVLEKSGLLGSTDRNAYYMAWMLQWSTVDGIRIYGRTNPTGLDDDFASLVFHQNTNVFFGRQVDHAWEFYHETNENRGRAKENEVNINWKQFLPGKHHYLFPQNIPMVRWAESFMTDEQRSQVDKKIRELMQKWDFDNGVYHKEFYGWMRNVAIMDMIENGQISMGQKNFSEIARESKLKKFEMIDMFVDRTKNKVYSDPDNFQTYLANPTNPKFMELNSKKNFYSTRSARQFPWMTLAMRAHWEIINKHSKRLFDREDVQSDAMEDVVKKLVTSGYVEKEQSVDFKRKNLGFVRVAPRGSQEELSVANSASGGPALILGNTFMRRSRQALEVGRKLGWEGRFLPILLPFVLAWEFIKRLPEQINDQFKRS